MFDVAVGKFEFVGGFVWHPMNEELPIFINDFTIKNPRTNLVDQNLIAFFEDDVEGLLQPEVTAEIFLIDQINNVSSPYPLLVYVVG